MFERYSHQAGNGNIHLPAKHMNHQACISAASTSTISALPGCVTRRVEQSDYQFGFASHPHDIESAAKLVARRYAWRGYDIEGALSPRKPKNKTTLIATCADQVHGTLTVRLDEQSSLLSEQSYPEEIHTLRIRGARLCEVGRLAFDEDINALEILGPLFHLAINYAHTLNGCTDAVIEVNPRHSGFYRRMFGFEVLGEQRICPRVSAPAILMKLSLNEAAQRADTEGGQRMGRKSIYPYCFGRKELEPQQSSNRGALENPLAEMHSLYSRWNPYPGSSRAARETAQSQNLLVA